MMIRRQQTGPWVVVLVDRGVMMLAEVDLLAGSVGRSVAVLVVLI